MTQTVSQPGEPKALTVQQMAEMYRINKLANKITRHYREPSFDVASGIYKGFFESPDDERLTFMYALIGLGFKEIFYKANYHWKYAGEFVAVEYIEGDIYITTL